jgi:hypothetical protein
MKNLGKGRDSWCPIQDFKQPITKDEAEIFPQVKPVQIVCRYESVLNRSKQHCI